MKKTPITVYNFFLKKIQDAVPELLISDGLRLFFLFYLIESPQINLKQKQWLQGTRNQQSPQAVEQAVSVLSPIWTGGLDLNLTAMMRMLLNSTPLVARKGNKQLLSLEPNFIFKFISSAFSKF